MSEKLAHLAIKPYTKFAIVSTFFAPGGIDSFWKYILEIAPKNIEFHVLTQSNLNYTPLKLENGAYKPLIFWFSLLKSTWAGFGYFYNQKPDVIAFNGTIAELHLTLSIFGVRVICPKWKPKIIRIFHSSALYKSSIKNAVNRILLWCAGRLYGRNRFVSDAVANYWRLPGTTIKRGFPRKQHHARTNGNQLRVGFFGRVSFEKGPDRFCEIINLLNPKLNILPVVIGDGNMMDLLKEKMPHAEFHGWVKDPSNLISSLDLVLISSRTEGLPLAFGECLEKGVPVIGFDVGGCRELLGLAAPIALIKDGDFDSLARLVESWYRDYDIKYVQFYSYYDKNQVHAPSRYLENLEIYRS